MRKTEEYLQKYLEEKQKEEEENNRRKGWKIEIPKIELEARNCRRNNRRNHECFSWPF